ncbi:hypothetical protein CLV30_12876 [Haloactinopolyspora alba]|uniref:Uncharacterized protein n=1 Tax=Haloactinopolyspora alba TaxID=648780 RepID=A0A2P8DF24_9ACTN|nr:hypothetical protein [Haloactinopolyspora alba]PSK95824.1 hypothetical protein CLV30_12876 [Haloactinopolyspora alba]
MTDNNSIYTGRVQDAIRDELAATGDDMDRYATIDRHREDLAGSLELALNQLTCANRAVDELTGPHLFDVEFADTTVGEDVRAAVLDAARQLRAAAALVAQVPK